MISLVVLNLTNYMLTLFALFFYRCFTRCGSKCSIPQQWTCPHPV